MGTARDLRALPVLPGMTTDRVREAYLSELILVTTPEAIKAFAARWRPLYILAKKQKIDKKAKDAKRFRITENNFLKLLHGVFDAEEALACLLANRTAGCPHMNQYGCAGAHIILPTVFVQAEMVAKHYGVSTDLALVQMNGGWGPYEAYTPGALDDSEA
jgi:hypothetical protein